MKKQVLLLSFCLSFQLMSFAQIDTVCNVLPVKDGAVYYTEVIEQKDASAKQLYSTSKIWISETFKDAKNVTQIDVEDNAITIKGLLNLSKGNGEKLRVNMTLLFKDGKCKYEITNVCMVISAINIDKRIEDIPAFTECNKETLRDFDDSIRKLIESYIAKLNSVDYGW